MKTVGDWGHSANGKRDVVQVCTVVRAEVYYVRLPDRDSSQRRVQVLMDRRAVRYAAISGVEER
jgi:hypothetical protein